MSLSFRTANATQRSAAGSVTGRSRPCTGRPPKIQICQARKEGPENEETLALLISFLLHIPSNVITNECAMETKQLMHNARRSLTLVQHPMVTQGALEWVGVGGMGDGRKRPAATHLPTTTDIS